MKSILSKTVIIIVIIVATIMFFIGRSNVKNGLNNDNIYVIFDAQKDSVTTIDWTAHVNLFPEDFNPKRVLVDISELSKLNNGQKLKWDSIMNSKYPRKIIETKNGTKHFSLSVHSGLSIGFKILETKNLKKSEIDSLNIISIDSLIKLIPDTYNLDFRMPSKEMESFKNSKFNIIEINKSKTSLLRVIPFVIEYN